MAEAATPQGWHEDVLAFWFEQLTPQDWWSGGPEVDGKVGRFADLHARVATADPAELAASPREALAAVIVLDQFPRNLFRGSAQAFSTDALALAVSKRAHAEGFNAELNETQKPFLAMPFEHSEDLADQDRSVTLFNALGNAELTRFAEEHRDIVSRFGRFPHRNRALGRESTEAESAFLAEHKGFGQ